MAITHPLLAPQDTADADLYEYACLRNNPAGEHHELWYHEQGVRSWLVVTRNTLTQEISSIKIARNVTRAQGRSR